MVKCIFVIVLVFVSSLTVSAQNLSGLRGFLKMKSHPGFQMKTPTLTTAQQPVFTYWQSSSLINYSENGRLKTSMSFDIHGLLRESFSSINLRKKGTLSYWRIQFSPQRTRPVFVYTIH